MRMMGPSLSQSWLEAQGITPGGLSAQGIITSETFATRNHYGGTLDMIYRNWGDSRHEESQWRESQHEES